MLRRTAALLTVCCLLASAIGIAQERRGGGPGGFGGPPVSNAMLLGIPEVQKELGLSDEQLKLVSGWIGQTQEQLQRVMAGFNFQDLQSLPDEERDQKLEEFRQKSDSANRQSDEKLAAILHVPQVARLNQLKLQRGGIQTLLQDDIAQKLSLTDEQRQKLRNLPRESFFPFSPPDVRQQAQTEALAILTDAQKTQWTELRGKEFTFPEGFGPGRGPGGPGGMMGQERKIVSQFDQDQDGRLNRQERTAAREFLKKEHASGGGRGFGPPGGAGPPPGGGFGPPPGFGPPGFGPPGGPPGGGLFGFGGRRDEPPKPGPRLSPAEVKPIASSDLYDPGVIRTLFLTFEDDDWETELADFNNTDVEIPATVVVDGKEYPNVGVHFRGMSSFMAVGAGSKRSLNLTFDFVDDKQRLYGYKTLNLLNSHEDPTFLHTVLYLEAARQHIPAPKANFVKVAINGESWGLYVNAQQFNKEFLTDNFSNAKGARWKVPGSPGGRGGLEYLGENVEAYKSRYTLKTRDDKKSWKSLITLCRTLTETPVDELESALQPILDIEGALWFLALENALINSDGYWIRASDYCIYLDDDGKFHIIPHDANETFQPAMGPGMFGGRGGGPGGGRPRDGGPGDGPPRSREGAPAGGPGEPGGGPPRGPGGGVELDPLVGLSDASKPLRSRLLAVPSLRTRYLEHVRTIADEWLDWTKLQPKVEQYVTLIDSEVKIDTKKLTSYDAFRQSVAAEPQLPATGRRPSLSLRAFAEQRRNFLLNHPAIKALPASK